MFEELAGAIDALDVAVDAREVRELLALRGRLEAKVSAAVAALDASGVWADEGATSIVAWLRSSGGLAPRDAARVAHVAKRVARLPATAAAWDDGRLTNGQVDAIAMGVTDATIDRFASHEPELIGVLAPLDVVGVRRAMRAWQARALAELDESTPATEPQREVHLSPVGDRWRLDGDLDPEAGAVIAAAIRVATTLDAPGEPARNPAQRRADALVDVCRRYLDHQRSRPGGRHRPHLNVVIDLEALEQRQGGNILDGPVLDPTTIQRLLCDSGIHRVVTDGRSTVLDYGTTTRTIPTPLWNTLVVRDEHCRFPGCDRTSSWCEAHHVQHWTDGGPSNLANLALLCTRHHHLTHQPGWHVKLLPDATLEVVSPTGTTRTTRPPGRLL